MFSQYRFVPEAEIMSDANALAQLLNDLVEKFNLKA